MILTPAKAATVSTSKFVLNIEGGTSRLRLMDKFGEGCHNIPKKMPIYGGWAWKQWMTLSLMPRLILKKLLTQFHKVLCTGFQTSLTLVHQLLDGLNYSTTMSPPQSQLFQHSSMVQTEPYGSWTSDCCEITPHV